MNRRDLDGATAERYARTALEALATRYPYATQHLTLSARDVQLPERLHPIFFGSYDWHSSVHMHWSLVRLLRLFPDLTSRDEIHQHFTARFTAANARAELAYFQRYSGYERPYGWAWLVTLCAELKQLAELESTQPIWLNAAERLRPLADHIFGQWQAFLPLAHYPQRAGTHANSAFSLILAHRAATALGHTEAKRAFVKAARKWFGKDTHYPIAYEPSGSDFLSNGLCEALLMSELDADFPAWWSGFSPDAVHRANWHTPPKVGSRTDGQLVHLDGLSLSRAWCLRRLAADQPSLAAEFNRSANRHLRAALPHVTGGDFVATHWLVSFALLALTDD